MATPYPMQYGWQTVGGPGSMSIDTTGGANWMQNSAHGRLMFDKNGNPYYADDAAPGAGTGGFPSPYPGGMDSSSGGFSMNASGPTATAKAFLDRVMAGKELPYDKKTQTAQLTQASDMNASAERARNSTFNANAAINGQSMTDPSLAGARMNSMATRQTGNAQAANAIAQNATKANFGAKMTAAGTLADIGAQENDMNARQRALTLSGAYDQVSRPANSTAAPFGPYPGINFQPTQQSWQQPQNPQQPAPQGEDEMPNSRLFPFLGSTRVKK